MPDSHIRLVVPPTYQNICLNDQFFFDDNLLSMLGTKDSENPDAITINIISQ